MQHRWGNASVSCRPGYPSFWSAQTTTFSLSPLPENVSKQDQLHLISCQLVALLWVVFQAWCWINHQTMASSPAFSKDVTRRDTVAFRQNVHLVIGSNPEGTWEKMERENWFSSPQLWWGWSKQRKGIKNKGMNGWKDSSRMIILYASNSLWPCGTIVFPDYHNGQPGISIAYQVIQIS